MVRRFPLYNAVNLDKETLCCLKRYQANGQWGIRTLRSRNVTADEASVFLALSSLGFIDDTDEQEWNSILQEFTEARNANTGELFGQILKVSKTLSWMQRL